MSSSSDAIFGVIASQVPVGSGATHAVFVDISPRQGALTLKLLSGSTLEIHGALNGSTMAGASLAPLIGTGYFLGTSEVLNIDGPARFYLMSTGATAIVCMLKGLTAPGYNSTSAPSS